MASPKKSSALIQEFVGVVAQRDELLTEVAQQMRQIEELENDRDYYRDKAGELSAELFTLGSRLNSQNERIIELELEAERLKSEAKRLESEVEFLKSEAKRLELERLVERVGRSDSEAERPTTFQPSSVIMQTAREALATHAKVRATVRYSDKGEWLDETLVTRISNVDEEPGTTLPIMFSDEMSDESYWQYIFADEGTEGILNLEIVEEEGC